jgi:hypothetical protein
MARDTGAKHMSDIMNSSHIIDAIRDNLRARHGYESDQIGRYLRIYPANLADSIDTGSVFKHDDLGRVAAFYRRVSGIDSGAP